VLIGAIVVALYGWLVIVAAGNALLMRRVRPGGTGPGLRPAVLIPARNEAPHIGSLVGSLVAQGARVYVFDDESDDGTGLLAAEAGATVIRASEPLPEGWTGKNRACHELAKVTAEDFAGDWLLFLDADVQVKAGFVDGVAGLIAARGSRVPVFSGFLRMLPGAGFEPVYLSWVPWVLLASNPFGLVARTGRGHNGFTNGQFVLWRAATYWEVRPHESLRSRVLEDVATGRLLAKHGIRIDVVDLAAVGSVRMYRTLREAIDGMSKNSVEIAGPGVGSWLLAFGFLVAGWAWTAAGPLWPWALGLLLASKFVTDRLVGQPIWTWPLMPITCTLAAFTVVRSWMLRRAGAATWKGRIVGR